MGIQPAASVFAAVLLFAVSDGLRIPYKCENPISPPMPLKQEKCFSTVDTGSQWSDDERLSVIDLINMYRGMIANECDAFKPHKPKPALFREATYNCDLEAEAKFDCPAKKSDFKSTEKFYRAPDVVMETRTATFHRVSPWTYKTNIDPATQLSNEVDSEVSSRNVIDFLRFVLDAKATEYGCYFQICDVEGKKTEFISCISDQPMRLTGPIYTPGQRCQSDDDCKTKYLDYQTCNKDYGMCEHKFTCKGDTLSMTGDPCKHIRDMISGIPNLRSFFDALIQIAVKNSDRSYTVKAFGIAVAEQYFLTSVTSNFKKYGSEDLYIIVGGSKVHQIRSKDMQPEITLGAFDMAAWQDLALIKIPDGSSFKFDTVISINGDTNVELHTLGKNSIVITAKMEGENIEAYLIQYYASPDECIEMFKEDRFLNFDSSYMACSYCQGNLKMLSGSPLGQILPSRNGVVLTGIRSVNSLDPGDTNTYLVTKIAPHCEWLTSVSYGAIKCVDVNLG